MSATDAVRVTTIVAVDAATAFEVFTEDIELWWRRDRRFRDPARPGVLRFEPGEGGRLVSDAGGGRVAEIGRVRVWEPADRLVFEWRGGNFAPDETTEVEVAFEAVDGGGRITLEHRGFDVLRVDHPARHGLVGEAFLSMWGLSWADLLVSLRAHARVRRGRE